MKSTRNKLRISRVRINANYSVQDICDLLGVHKNTVREWIRKGLPKIDEQRPFLIHGKELKEFLRSRQQSRKSSCKVQEFYCFRCRSPRTPLAMMADIEKRNDKTVMLKGLCSICETPLHKIQSIKIIRKLFEIFDIPTQQKERLISSLRPSVDCHFEEEGKR